MADVALETIEGFINKCEIDTSKRDWRCELPKPPQVEFDDSQSYYWNVRTNKGSMKFKLFPDVAPMHVSSTIYLTLLKFYDGLSFHRVIQGFMAQGGCPYGRGTGGPGYDYGGEFSASVRHDRPGLLSMANAGPNTDGSQFFITFVPTPHLDDNHTIFGEVVEGMDTLNELEKAGSRSGQPSEPLVMEACTITVT